MAQLLVEPRRGDSVDRAAPASVRGEQRLDQKSLPDVLRAERELADAEAKLIEARRGLVQASYATLASMGRLESVALRAAATRHTGGWQAEVEAHNTAKGTEPSWRTSSMRDRAD